MKSDHKIILQVSRKKKHFLNKLDGKYMMCAVSLFFKASITQNMESVSNNWKNNIVCICFIVPKACPHPRTGKTNSTGTGQDEIKQGWRCWMQTQLTRVSRPIICKFSYVHLLDNPWRSYLSYEQWVVALQSTGFISLIASFNRP